MRFEGKVAVVTGAALGIGRAAAVAFAAEGARVAILDLNEAEGEQTVGQIQGSQVEARLFRTDVSQEEEVRATMEEIAAGWGRLDILVNNAGVYYQANALDTSLENWERVLSVNLTGAFLCTKYAVREMVKNGGGVVVNVASEAGLVGIKGQVAYNVSKGGLIALTRSCAVDFAEFGVRVNSICPGTTDTPLVQAAVQRAPDPTAARRALESCRPLDRLGRPEEIAAAILFLASGEVGYATGAILSVDGGYTTQ
jgi:NAD(P)-dependent dehydrogenase (short-subunit alcohol dehydrogenase family)